MKKPKKSEPEDLKLLIIEAKIAISSVEKIVLDLERVTERRINWKRWGYTFDASITPALEVALWEAAKNLLKVFYAKGLGKEVMATLLTESMLNDRCIARLIQGGPFNPDW